MSLPLLGVVATPERLTRQSAAVGGGGATTTIYVIVALLVVIGVLLVALAVWLVRQTRPDPQLLAPLEHMERRRWRRLDPQGRRRALDELRPPGAVPIDRAKSTPAVDQEFATQRPVRDFSDLVERDEAPSRKVAAIDAANTESVCSEATVADIDEPVSVTDEAVPDDDEGGSTAPDGVAVTSGDEDAESVTSARPGTESDDDVPGEPTDDQRADRLDPLVIDTELADPSLLDTPFGHRRTADDTETDDADSDESVHGGLDADRAERSTADTSDHENDLEVDVPLMPGEGLLRRPRSDVDRR